MTSGLRIGLDIGATKVLGVVMGEGGTVVAQARQDTRPGPDGILATVLAVLGPLAASLDGTALDGTGRDGAARDAAVSGATRNRAVSSDALLNGARSSGPLFTGSAPVHIGIGVPGIIDRDRGAVRHAVNLGLGGDWFPLAGRLAERTGATVVVENDLNAATWGAHVLSGADDLAYLALGTGLAAGFVLSGSLRRGAHGAAGEIGHVPVDPAGARCSCGQRGCLELSASGSALSAAWPPEGEMPPAVALFAAAAAGDPAAVTARDRYAARVADAVRMLGLAVDPAAIIIGGGVAHVGEPLRAAVTAALRAQAAASPFLAALDLAGRVSLLPGRLPVAAIGAALIGNAG